MENDNYLKVNGVTARPRRRVKENPCIGCFKRLFKKLYPVNPKKAWTKQGIWLRRMIIVCLISHFVFFVVGLVMIGFEPMAMNIILAVWSYSVYLTLNELSIILYVILICGVTINGFYWIEENSRF